MSQFKIIQPGDTDALAAVAHNYCQTLSRPKLLVLQYTKLLNYFIDEMAEEWGGCALKSEGIEPVLAGYRQFLVDMKATDAADGRWLHKKYQQYPWGPSNFKLTHTPSTALGAPYEPYLSVNGALVNVNQASRMLAIDVIELVELKLSLLLDERVLSEAVQRMLKPRPLWPRVSAMKGGKARTFRP